MSETIDSRVVEMRFDNKNFVNNVHDTMSTLDKLKQKLNLTGASKGLENLDSAAKKVNMNGLGSAVETVHAKFSALEVMGVTALANITNSAVNAGKKIVSALTIDPIKTGFQEYETQINAVQTILANTSHNGTTIDEVNTALDTLNAYADKTIYNFTEMTRNIGTFTAAGVDLQTSVDSIQGIANLAAVSGSTSQQASTAMYQLSQALAAGKVSLMDWNSVVNAGMGGKVFQDALVRTSELLKTGAKDAIATHGSFRESLTKGEWLTTEVLTETLKQFAGAYDEAELMAQGFTQEQAKEIAAMAKTAEEAATKVKTWTQLWDVVKESAQSGWTQTWELIFGDFEEAKALLTPLADFFTGIINKISDTRNALLEGALGKSFTGLVDKISTTTAGVENAVDALKDYGEVVDKIINGDFGNGQSRWDALTEAGYDWAHAQNLVNEKLGDGTRHATDYKEAQDGVTDSQGKATKAQKRTIEQLAAMSDEELKNIEYTNEQIRALRELEEQADKTGIPLNKFVENIDQINGRYLLLNGFKNIGQSIVKVFTAMGQAWKQVFPPATSEQLYNLIAGFHKLTTNLYINTGTAVKLRTTFKGLFAALDIVLTLVGGPLKIAFKVLTTILSYFHMDILDITSAIGRAIFKFRNWLDSVFDVNGALDVIVPIVKDCIEAIQDWVEAFKDMPLVQKIIERVRETFNSLKDLDFKKIGKNLIDTIGGWTDAFTKIPQVQKLIENVKKAFSNLKDIDLKSIGQYIVDGFVNGIGEGARRVIESIIELAKSVITSVCEIFDIHSPSKVFFAIGGFIVTGLLLGLQNGFGDVLDWFKGLGTKIVEFIGNIDWGTVFAGGVAIGMLATIKKLADGFASLTAPLEGLGELLDSAGEFIEKSTKNINKILKGFGKTLNAFAFSIKAKAIRNIAISLAILVGAVALLTFVDTGKLWSAVGAVAVITVILIALVGVVEGLAILSAKFGSGSIDFGKLSLGLLGISASILLIAGAAKLIGSIENAEQAFKGLAGIVGGLIAVIAAYGLLVKGDAAQNINKLGGMLIKLSLSMLLLVGVVKLVSKLSWDEMGKGGAFALAFVGFVALLGGITTYSKSIDGLGGMILKLSLSMLLLVGVVKLVGKLSPDEMKKGAWFAGAFIAFVAVLGGITRYTKSVDKLGGTILKLSLSMLLLVGVVKLVGKLTPDEMKKGGAFALAFVAFVAALGGITRYTKSVDKLGRTILAMSVAIGILAGVSILLSIIDTKGLVKGIAAVGFLSLFMMGMIAATKNANDCKGNLIAMSVAIGVMAVAVAALSFIDWTKLTPATIALGALMGMFALIAKAAGSMNGAMGSLIVMTVAIGVLAGALYLLSGLPIDSVLGSSAALSILLLSLSASMAIIGKFGTVAPTALGSIVVMTLVIGALAGILYLIKDLPAENTLSNVISLSTLLVAVSVIAAVLGAMSSLLTAAIPAVISLGIVIGELAILLAAMGGLAQIPGLEWLISEGGTFLQSIGTAIGQFVGGIVGGIAEGVASVLPAIGASLSGFMTNIQGFIAGAQNINESVLIGVGYLSAALLLLTAAEFVAGIAAIGGLSLVALGSSLTGFIMAALPFLTIIQTVDPASVEAAKTLAEMILVLTAAELLSGIADFLGGDTDFASFGEQLVAFGSAVCEFSNTLVKNGGINNEAVTSAANAGKVMAELQKSLYGAGGLKQDIFGEKDLGVFGEQLKAFGTAICEFSNTITDNGGISSEAVESAANAGSMMAELQSSLYGAGGLKQDIFGEKDLGTFGEQLKTFGTAMCEFSNTLEENGGVDSASIESAANAGQLMAALQGEIEGIGGVKADLFGDKDLGKFGTQIKNFGQAMVDFSTIVSGNISDEAVTAAANAGSVMAEVQDAIPTDTWFDGKLSISEFGDKIVAFGTKIVEYSNKVAEVDNASVLRSLTSARGLASLTRSIVGLDVSGISSFKNVKTIGSAISEYYNKVSGIETATLSSSISSAQRLVSFINSLASLDSSGIGSFKTAIASLSSIDFSSVQDVFSSIEKTFNNSLPKMTSIGSNIVQSLIKGIKSKQLALTTSTLTLITAMHKSITSKATMFKTAGVTLMSNFTSGIVSQTSKVKSAITTLVSTSITSTKAYYDSFYDAGAYLVEGFTNGILNNAYKAEIEAAAMAAAAVKAAEEELGINSPSKVFYGIGDYTGQGFVNALADYAKTAYKAGSNMGESAKSGLSNAIRKIAGVVSGDMEVQPTIRPVVDLSNVKSGVSTIDDMLSMGPTIGVSSNLRAINYMMNKRSQNGVNDDVVSAIGKLNDKLENIGNTTYVLENVSYDDGSNISSAIETIVQSARIARRV